MNALEKWVDLFLAVVLLFLFPLLYYGSGKTVSMAILAGQAGESFLRRISTAGEITAPVWQELETALCRYGCREFQLERERDLFEPVDSLGTVAEYTHTEDTVMIKKELGEKGCYRLLYGDRITLILYCTDIPTVYRTSVRTGATGL